MPQPINKESLKNATLFGSVTVTIAIVLWVLQSMGYPDKLETVIEQQAEMKASQQAFQADMALQMLDIKRDLASIESRSQDQWTRTDMALWTRDARQAGVALPLVQQPR